MDASTSLRDAENALRDFAEEILVEKFGDEWAEKSGAAPDRVQKWKDRRTEEAKKLTAGNVDPRLLYYSDSYDLKTIIVKHWELFKPCFGDKKTMEIFLDKMENFRNPDAHRRRLLPAQEQLLHGISGEIRNAITNYRSKQAPKDEFFPRIEYAQDSFGNVCKGGDAVDTERTLRPGDVVSFSITAWDPMEGTLEYHAVRKTLEYIVDWNPSNTFEWTVLESDIARMLIVEIEIRSDRSYHANAGYDDRATFVYSVLPPPPRATPDTC